MTEWQGSTPTQFYIISLMGLPEEVKLGLKRVKLFQTTFVKHDRLFLTPEYQLSKRQPTDVLDHILSRYNEKKRPTGMILPGGLQSLEDLKDLAQILESQRVERLKQDAAGTGEEVAPAGPVVQSAKFLEGLDDDDGTSGKKRQRRKGVATDSNKPAALQALKDDATSTAAPSSKASSLPALADGRPSSVTGKSDGSKAKKGASDQLEGMDDDMRQVAEFHLSSAGAKNASAKSLANLVPSKFMDGVKDHATSHALVAVPLVAF